MSAAERRTAGAGEPPAPEGRSDAREDGAAAGEPRSAEGSPTASGAGPLQPAIRVIMMPKDTNALGTIFGGIILSYIDQAGAVEATRHIPGRLVTVAMNEVEFHAPVFVGDLVSFYTETVRRGRTSLTVRVTVEAQRRRIGDGGASGRVKVTEATLVYVHVDDRNRPLPIPEPAGG